MPGGPARHRPRAQHVLPAGFGTLWSALRTDCVYLPGRTVPVWSEKSMAEHSVELPAEGVLQSALATRPEPDEQPLRR